VIELTVDIKDDSGVRGLLSGLRDQIPYAASVALNTTANDAQQAIQAKLPAEFTLRRKEFIERTIYRSRADFAKKDNLVATVRVNPARDFLAKFEDDKVKVAKQHALAVPIVRMGAPAIIISRSDPRYLKRVMALIDAQGGKQVGPFKKRQAKKASKQSFFLLKTKKGQTLVMQRDAGDIKVLYAFEHSVPIEKHRLHFEEIAMQTALARWGINAEAAIAKAIATMR
jgi:hypothetical protein